MKYFWFSLILITGCLVFVQPVIALDTAQKTAMNSAITGQSGEISITSSALNGATSTTTTYTDGIAAIQLAIGSMIVIFYLLFSAWLAKSQYVAWAERDIDSKEGFGSIVKATLLLLLVVFIVTYVN